MGATSRMRTARCPNDYSLRPFMLLTCFFQCVTHASQTGLHRWFAIVAVPSFARTVIARTVICYRTVIAYQSVRTLYRESTWVDGFEACSLQLVLYRDRARQAKLI